MRAYTVIYSREGHQARVIDTAATLAAARKIARDTGATKRARAWNEGEECWAVRGQRDAGLWIEASASTRPGSASRGRSPRRRPDEPA